MTDGEYLELLDKIADLEGRLESLDNPSEGSISCLVQTFETEDDYPTDPASFFAVHPVAVDGLEKEGEAATFTADEDRTFYVLNHGPAVPPADTKLLATSVNGRWVVYYAGGES